MFDNLRRTRVQVDADRLKNQAAEVGAVLSGASVRAGHTAEHLAHQAKDAAVQAKDWAAPRVERAWYQGRATAQPKVEQAVEQAAEKALPLVDKTHDRLVEDILPRLVAAINAAAAAAVIGADRARDAANERLTELAHVPPPEPPKSHTGAKVFWSIAGLAVIGAVLTALRRNQPTTDPWAEEPWEDEPATDAPLAKVREGLAGAADAVGEAAGEAVAVARGTGEAIAEKARSVTKKAPDPAVPGTAAPVDETDGAAADLAAALDPAEAAPAAPKPVRAPRRTGAKPVDPEQDAGTANS